MSQLFQTFAFVPSGGIGEAYFFNGTDETVTIPPWTPLGLPYAVDVTFQPLSLTSEDGVISGADTDMYGRSAGAGSSYLMTFLNDIGTPITLQNDTNTPVGQTQRLFFLANPSETSLLNVGSGLRTAVTDVSAAVTQDAITTFASLAGTSNFFNGGLANFRLTDNSPIQDVGTTAFDGARFVTTDLNIFIPLADLFEARLEAISGPDPLTGFVDALGSSTTQGAVRFFGSTHATHANQIGLIGDNGHATYFAGAAYIRLGQHFKLAVFNNATGVVIMEVDGEPLLQVEQDPPPFGNVDLDLFGDSQAATPLPTGWTLANIDVRNNSNGDHWFYTLDEGATRGPELAPELSTFVGIAPATANWTGTELQVFRNNSPSGDSHAVSNLSVKTVIGVEYEVLIDVLPSHAWSMNLGGFTSTISFGSGAQSFQFTAVNTTTQVYFGARNNINATLVVSSLSVREVIAVTGDVTNSGNTIVNGSDAGWLGNGIAADLTTSSIDGYTQGLPMVGSNVALDSNNTIDHYWQGIPFTTVGKIATALEGIVANYEDGSMPVDAAGRICVTTSPYDHFAGGVPFSAAGQIVLRGTTATLPNFRDTFTDTNGTNLFTHVPEIGPQWTQNIGAFSYTTVDGVAGRRTGGSVVAAADNDVGLVDFVLYSDLVQVGGTDLGMYIRGTSIDDCFIIVSGGNVFDRTAGVSTNIASFPSQAGSAWRMKVVVQGDNIQIFNEDTSTKLFDFTMTTKLTNTGFGLYSFGATNISSNVEVFTI